MPLFASRPSTTLRLLVALLTSILSLVAFTGTTYAATNTYCNPASGPTESTTFDVPGGGNWGDGDNWTNGLPDLRCDAVIPSGDTVTLTTTPGEGNEPTNTGGSATGLTVEPGATLIVEGVSGTAAGNEFNAIGLTVGGDGLTIDQGATLDVEATGNVSAATGDSPGETPGGAANLTVDSFASSPAPLDNQGTINASSSDGAWGESLNVGGTVTNTGSIVDQSGKLTLQGQQVPYVFNNTGTVSVASGAAFTMLAGDGSAFDNDGTFANQGTATLQQSMYWIQSGGSETGNPVELTGSETLQDSAGTGAFEVTDCASAGVTGTIPAGQTVSVLGGCSGTSLYLGGPNAATVVNDGTLALDAPTANGADAILQGGELDNHGTLDSMVAAATSANQLLTPLVNESDATVNLTGGRLVQTAGTATSNAGTVNIGAGALWLVQGGSFTNAGTLAPQISGGTSLGQLNLTVGGKFTAGGTLTPTLTPGYSPAKGTEFPFITLNGGSVSGRFASETGGFSADYSKEAAASNPYVGLIYGVSTKTVRRPTAGRLSGGIEKLVLKLSCAKSAKSCDRYTVLATAKKKTIFSASGTVKSGKSVTRTLKLTRTGKALLRRLHTLRVRVLVRAGGKTVESRTVTVRWKK
jgi:hypothetical protein